MAVAERTFTCDSCGATGSLTFMGQHACEHNQYVDEHGGRCEDYPCCGHTDGDGCRQVASHTKAFWQERYDALDPDERFEVDAYGWPDSLD